MYLRREGDCGVWVSGVGSPGRDYWLQTEEKERWERYVHDQIQGKDRMEGRVSDAKRDWQSEKRVLEGKRVRKLRQYK